MPHFKQRERKKRLNEMEQQIDAIVKANNDKLPSGKQKQDLIHRFAFEHGVSVIKALEYYGLIIEVKYAEQQAKEREEKQKETIEFLSHRG